MTPLPTPSMPDRLRLYALLHPESAELLREAADRIDVEQDHVEMYRTALGLACSDGWSDGRSAMESYIETAKAHIAALRAVDDSDIMPGSEFDGPVAL